MKKLFRKIAIIGTLSGMLFGLEGCTGDLLDTSPSYSFSSSNVWTSPILARAAVMGFIMNCMRNSLRITIVLLSVFRLMPGRP